MTKTRLEAFSDGVIAIIITIMVLELKPPHETSWIAFKPLIPIFLSYLLSFTFIAIYWGNHHHLFHTVKEVSTKILWSNLHLLFWLSLIPFTTAWMGENSFNDITVASYAVLQIICGAAYYILLQAIVRTLDKNSTLLAPLKKQSKKGKISLIFYTLAIPVAFIQPAISAVLFTMVAMSWIIPDRNIEKTVKESEEN